MGEPVRPEPWLWDFEVIGGGRLPITMRLFAAALRPVLRGEATRAHAARLVSAITSEGFV